MPRKPDIEARLQRHLKSIVALVLRRNSERRVEFEWAIHGAPIPAPQKTPPPWVALAIKHASKPLLKWQAKLEGSSLHGKFLEVLGAQTGLSSTIFGPSPTVAEAEKEMPEIAILREAVSKQIERQLTASSKKQRKAVKAFEKVGRPANPLEFQTNIAHFQRGLGALVDKSGEYIGMREQHLQLAQMLWFWWPELKHTKNAREVRAALAEAGGEFSPDLVSKLCSKFKMFAGKRGRPRANKIGQ